MKYIIGIALLFLISCESGEDPEVTKAKQETIDLEKRLKEDKRKYDQDIKDIRFQGELAEQYIRQGMKADKAAAKAKKVSDSLRHRNDSLRKSAGL